MRSRVVCLLVSGWLAAPASAETVTPYGYPLTDPLEATVVGTPEAYRAELPTLPYEVREVRPLPGREVPDLFWYTAGLRYLVSPQPGRAPLAFVIPGAGANFGDSQSVILQQTLFEAGLHVVALPSPLHPNFVVSASRSGRPGLLDEDAQDLYRVMEAIRRAIGDELEIAEYHLAGYSLGATHAAFVSKLDDERGAFAFGKVLLINPPVDLARSARVLDAMFERHINSMADFNALFEQLMAAASVAYEPGVEVEFGRELVYEIHRRRPLQDTTLEALIGIAFRLASIDLIFSADVVSGAGLLVAEDRPPGITDSLTPYFKAASRLSFEDYARAILLPYYRERAPRATLEQLSEWNSLVTIEHYLRMTDKIGLMHNADDMLVDEADLQFLTDVFGRRARIYPTGGHVGNILYKDNVAYAIDFFSD